MDEHRYPIAIIWRELLAGDLSTLGRIESVARCRDSKTGCYRHLKIVNQLGDHGAHCAIRAVHELLWIDWMRALLEQQHADLLLYLRNRSKDAAEMKRKIVRWQTNVPFVTLPPECTGDPERALFLQTLGVLLRMLHAEYCSSDDSSHSFQRVLAVVRSKYRELDFSLSALSMVTKISQRHLSRLFRHHLGKTFLQFVTGNTNPRSFDIAGRI